MKYIFFISGFLSTYFHCLDYLTAPAAGKHTRQQRALETEKKGASRTKEYGLAGENSPQPVNTMDELLLFHLPGDQLAHLNEVLGCKILQAEKAEGCV